MYRTYVENNLKKKYLEIRDRFYVLPGPCQLSSRASTIIISHPPPPHHHHHHHHHRQHLLPPPSIILKGTMIKLILAALLLSSISVMMVDNNDAIIVIVEAFRLSVVVSSPPRSSSSSSSSPIKSDNYYNDFDVENGNVDNDYHLLASLRQRRRSLNSRLYDRWTSGNTTSSRIGFTINESFYNNNTSRFDWVRRLAIGTYPHVVCGSASGAIYVADVEEGKLLASASCAHYPSTSCNDDDEDDDDDLLEGEDNFALLRFLYGDYDGGGVLAVAMTSSSSSPVHSDRSVDLIASAGREGGVKLHRVVSGSDELKYIGSVPMCSDDDNNDDDDDNSVIVTCLKFDSVGRLYAGGGDGRLRVTIFDNDNSNKEVGMRTTLIPSQVNPSSSSSFSSLWKWKQGELAFRIT